MEALKKIIDGSNNIVFFGGAGVSCESGIPDFRSVDGLYYEKYAYSPEEMLSRTFFYKQTEEFFRFYKNKMIYEQAQPNAAHIKLAQLEEQGKLKGIITQNIDGLHQKAGAQNVVELHGSIHRNYCIKCGEFYGLKDVIGQQNIPVCRKCEGIIKPDVVLYEEALNEQLIKEAVRLISQAQVLVIGGTSLVVYPAAGFIHYFQGDKLVVINKEPISTELKIDLQINDAIGKILASI